jgi:ABC-2 type transport system ATP-binding protein
VSKKYGRKIGIRGIDLTVNTGDIFGLIGPDNAGKSTILRILMNFVYPSDGEIIIFGLDATKEAKEIKKDVAYVPAEAYFYHNMKAGKYIRLMTKMHHQKVNDRYDDLIKLFEIDPKEKFEMMDRSDQKKVALAAALSIEPKLLLLDEPTRGLDAAMKNRLYQYLTEMQANGTTIIITGRDVDEIYGLCNKIAIIENGEITVDDKAFALENPNYFKDRFDFTECPKGLIDEEIAITDMEDTIVIIPQNTDEFIKQNTKNEEANSDDNPQNYKNIKMKSIGFDRDAFTNIGAKIVKERAGKIIIEYSGDRSVLAKLLYDLNMDDIRISSKDLQEEFLPFYEGGEEK